MVIRSGLILTVPVVLVLSCSRASHHSAFILVLVLGLILASHLAVVMVLVLALILVRVLIFTL